MYYRYITHNYVNKQANFPTLYIIINAFSF